MRRKKPLWNFILFVVVVVSYERMLNTKLLTHGQSGNEGYFAHKQFQLRYPFTLPRWRATDRQSDGDRYGVVHTWITPTCCLLSMWMSPCPLASITWTERERVREGVREGVIVTQNLHINLQPQTGQKMFLTLNQGRKKNLYIFFRV